MLKVKIVCVGKLKEKYFTDAVNEYLKRLQRFCKAEVIEAEECLLKNRPSPAEIDKALETEAKDILKNAEGFLVALDKDGEQLDSGGLAELFEKVSGRFSTITFIIGGSHGLNGGIKKNCNFTLSFGKMTFPHQMFRLMLSEQIYRAFMINGGGEYHK